FSVTILTTDSLVDSFKEKNLSIKSQEKVPLSSFRKLRSYDRFCENFLAANPSDIVLGLDRNRFQTHLRAGNGVHRAYLEKRKMIDPFFKRLSFAFNPLHQTILSFERKAFESPQLKILIANSHMVKQEILHFYATDPKKIHVIHNGMEWQEMHNDFDEWPQKKGLIASALKLDPSVFHFLFIGHHYRRKGLEKLLEALSLLRKETFHLSVVGKDKDIASYKTLAHRLNLGEKVSFFGSQPNLRPFYQLADCLVVPSFYDPFANVTVEALAMGLFVISSKTNGGHEVLSEESGLVIDDLMRPDAIADTLRRGMKRAKTLQGARGIRESVRHLDFSNQLKHLTDLVLS
ncbi:MAG: glycosyltransferase, partial [Anaerolineae bacterium]